MIKWAKRNLMEVQHSEYAATALSNARREFLVACDQMEHWEAMKNYRAKQIERLEKYVQETNTNGGSSFTVKHVGSVPGFDQIGNPLPDGGVRGTLSN